MAPKSVIEVRTFGETQAHLLACEHSAAEINGAIAALIGEFEDVIITTPGYGVRVYTETCYGLFSAMGNTEQDAQDQLNKMFERWEWDRSHGIPETCDFPNTMVPVGYYFSNGAGTTVHPV